MINFEHFSGIIQLKFIGDIVLTTFALSLDDFRQSYSLKIFLLRRQSESAIPVMSLNFLEDDFNVEIHQTRVLISFAWIWRFNG